MNFLTKLDALMAESGLNRRSLAAGAGIPYTTIASFWGKGYENVKLSTVQRLCDFLHVSMDYLLRDEITDRNYGLVNASTEPPEDERLLLDAFRKLNPPARERALLLVQDMAGNPACVEEANEKAI